MDLNLLAPMPFSDSEDSFDLTKDIDDVVVLTASAAKKSTTKSLVAGPSTAFTSKNTTSKTAVARTSKPSAVRKRNSKVQSISQNIFVVFNMTSPCSRVLSLSLA